MEKFSISQSVITTAAYIAIFIGPLHIGVPLGVTVLVEEFHRVFDNDRRLSQRVYQHIVRPNLEDIYAVLDNRAVRKLW